MDYTLSKEDFNKLMDFAFAGEENGTKYPGMTYEQGMRNVLEVMDGNMTVAEATE